MATCKRPKRTIAHTNHANCLSNSCSSRSCEFTAYALGDLSAATRPIAIRRRIEERMTEQRDGLLVPGWCCGPGWWFNLPRDTLVARSIKEVGTNALLVLEHVSGSYFRHYGAGSSNTLERVL
jgi:hypothetical protein